MSITEFIAQAHPATLDWIEDALMEKLLEVDKWQRATELSKELREVTKWSLNKQSSSPSLVWWDYFLPPLFGNVLTESPLSIMQSRRWIDPEDHAKQVVERFTLEDLIEYVTQDLIEMYSDMGEWEYEDELKRWYDD